MQPGDTGTNALAAREFLPFRQDDQLMNFIGEVAISEVEAPLALRLICAPHAANPQGILHGGVLSAACDVAMYEAARRAFDAECVTVAQEMKFLRPGRAGTPLYIVCDILKSGRRTAFCSARALQGDELIAHSTGQLARI